MLNFPHYYDIIAMSPSVELSGCSPRDCFISYVKEFFVDLMKEFLFTLMEFIFPLVLPINQGCSQGGWAEPLPNSRLKFI